MRPEQVPGAASDVEGAIMDQHNIATEETTTETSSGSDRPQKMTRAEAGRKGGKTTKQRYGEEHFGRIGKIGGKKGGETTKERYGSEFYQRIGRLGGSK